MLYSNSYIYTWCRVSTGQRELGLKEWLAPCLMSLERTQTLMSFIRVALGECSLHQGPSFHHTLSLTLSSLPPLASLSRCNVQTLLLTVPFILTLLNLVNFSIVCVGFATVYFNCQCCFQPFALNDMNVSLRRWFDWKQRSICSIVTLQYGLTASIPGYLNCLSLGQVMQVYFRDCSGRLCWKLNLLFEPLDVNCRSWDLINSISLYK